MTVFLIFLWLMTGFSFISYREGRTEFSLVLLTSVGVVAFMWTGLAVLSHFL